MSLPESLAESFHQLTWRNDVPKQPVRGGFGKFFGGLLIALGVFTAIAAVVASGEMATAYFTQHFPHGFWPIRNHGEMAVLFCFVFLYMASQGDGRWSARSLLKGKRL